jgi:hypothetical protein
MENALIRLFTLAWRHASLPFFHFHTPAPGSGFPRAIGLSATGMKYVGSACCKGRPAGEKDRRSTLTIGHIIRKNPPGSFSPGPPRNMWVCGCANWRSSGPLRPVSGAGAGSTFPEPGRRVAVPLVRL